MQELNIHRNKGVWPELERQRQESRKLIKVFQFLAQKAVRQGGHAHFEWPRYSKGWGTPEARVLQTTLPFRECHLDGCQGGVRNKDVECVKKHWTIFTTSQAMYKKLHGVLCKKDHRHGQATGKDLELTGHYTPQFVRKILHAIKEGSKVTVNR